MSHSVTVTRTTTTASSSAIILNTGIFRTPSCLLKLFETIIGAVVLGLIAHYNGSTVSGLSGFSGGSELALIFIVSFAFLVTTFLMLISSLVSLMAATILPKTVFEFLYHLFAFIFYLSASLSLLVLVTDKKKSYYGYHRYYEAHMAAAVLGLVNAVLYLLSTVFSFKSYKSG